MCLKSMGWFYPLCDMGQICSTILWMVAFLKQKDLGRMCEERHEIAWFGARMGNIQECVEGLIMGQTQYSIYGKTRGGSAMYF